MNFTHMTNPQLELSFARALRKENHAFVEVIEHLVEINHRKLHQERGCLKRYLMERFQVAETAAYQRIDVMKLVLEIPQSMQMIKENKINMSQVAELKRAVGQKQSETKTKITKEEKVALLENIAGKSNRETQEALGKGLNLNLHQSETHRAQKDGSIRSTFTQDQELQDLLKECQDISGHTMMRNNQDRTLASLLKHLAKEYIKKHTPKAQSKSENLTPARKRNIIQEQKCCQFKTGENEICASTHLLEIDHIQPKWDDGNDSKENLRVYCRFHNQLMYEIQSGKHRPEENPDTRVFTQ